MYQKSGCLLLLWMWGVVTASAQTKYWVFFKDKNPHDAPAVSAKTLENRRLQGLTESDDTDLPVNKEYLKQLQRLQCQPVLASRSVSYTHLDVYKRQALSQPTHDFYPFQSSSERWGR